MDEDTRSSSVDPVSPGETDTEDRMHQLASNTNVSTPISSTLTAFPEQVQQIYTAEHPSGFDNMRSIEQTLPQSFVQRQSQHPYAYQTVPSMQVQYPFPHNPQYAGQPTMNYNPNFVNSYVTQYASTPQTPQRQQSYTNLLSEQMTSPQSHNAHTVNYGMAPNMLQAQTVMRPHQNTYFQQPAFNHQMHYPPSNSMNMYHTGAARTNRSSTAKGPQHAYQASLSLDTITPPNMLRGPPRKPKQSGFALWVGNLPPGTNIVDLKDHFAREARDDIESVFLISKSNCAFVNYRSESACTAAMSRFHDSRFQGVRLVCRLRRGSASTSAITVSTSQSPVEASNIESTETTEEQQDLTATTTDVSTTTTTQNTSQKVKEKFFIVKSLTLEDLERSVKSGAWATQPHNETILNNAYQSAESVYLIFSANKSGEYFGYARMSSAIDDEAAATIDYPTREETSQPEASDLPIAIPTAATATAPKGRIIDDSSRGTIFWEADQEKKEQDTQEEEGDDDPGQGEESAAESSAKPQAFGKPFKVVWMSTDSLPFHRTRGMRNPWNSNREIKIARDGTEIEPMMGRRLISMFHRPQMAQPGFVGNRQGGTAQIPGVYGPNTGQPPGAMFGRPY